jgi:hypothetical protein
MIRAAACITLISALLASPAAADQRRIGLTSFDRIEISGDMVVEVRADHRISATVEGSRDALDSLEVVVDNRVLRIRQLSMGTFGPRRGDAGPVTIRVAAQNLSGLSMQGAGRVSVDGLRGRETRLWLNGPGQLDVRNIATDNLTIRSGGNGTLTLAGRALNAAASINGGGTVEASALAVQDLRVTTVGTGTSRFAAVRTAEVTAGGNGGVTVTGNPRCTVRNISGGTVMCGRQSGNVSQRLHSVTVHETAMQKEQVRRAQHGN